MLNIAIVEDSDSDAENLIECLENYKKISYKQLIYSRFKNAESFFAVGAKKFDVVFLDIQLPEMNGLEAAKQIRKTNNTIRLVFLTNLRRYVTEGYVVNASDYIIKPIDIVSFNACMSRIVSFFERDRKIDIFIKTGKNEEVYLSSLDILYVEAYGHLVLYHTAEKVISEWGSLKKTEDVLSVCGNFCRCNNCYLVNLRYVDSVENNCVVIGKDRLKMSISKTKKFIAALNNYLSGY